MHVLLYCIAVTCSLIGVIWGISSHQVMLIANGMLAAVIIGAVAKIVHSLDEIEGHLGRISRSQIRNALPIERPKDNALTRLLAALNNR